MRRALAILCLVAGCRSDPAPAAEVKPAVEMKPAAHLEFVAAGEGDVAQLVAREVSRAGQQRVVVYVGAAWCEPCRRFHDAAVAGALDKALPSIRFVEFDLDRDEERLRAAGYTSQYIPLFAVPLPDGRASGKQIAGSVKGPGAPGEITPRLRALLGPS